MEFRHLEVFVAVAELKSFSKAADYLYLTQPTVSSHVNSLEKELQIKLFNRTTKTIQITPEGENFLTYARRIIELKDSALDALHSQKMTTVRLGASTIPSAYLLPQILTSFHDKNPNVYFDIVQNDSDVIEDRVADGSLDLGLIGHKTDRTRCTYQPFAKDHLVIVMPPTNYYKELLKQKVELRQLLLEPMIIREQGSGTLQEAKRLLPEEGLGENDLNIIANHSDPESIKQMVTRGMGISIFSEFAVQDEIKTGKLLAYPLSQSTPRYFYVAQMNYRNLTPSAMLFLEHVLHYYDLEDHMEES